MAFPALAKKTGRDQLWTSAYYVGTAGQVSAETIRRYITECQGQLRPVGRLAFHPPAKAQGNSRQDF
jgi:hypothetical protein